MDNDMQHTYVVNTFLEPITLSVIKRKCGRVLNINLGMSKKYACFFLETFHNLKLVMVNWTLAAHYSYKKY